MESQFKRFGGDEFLVVLPDTGRKEGQIALDRLGGFVEQWNRRNESFGYTLGLSAGMSQFVPDASSAESLIEAADSEMYRAKSQKHDRKHALNQTAYEVEGHQCKAATICAVTPSGT